MTKMKTSAFALGSALMLGVAPLLYAANEQIPVERYNVKNIDLVHSPVKTIVPITAKLRHKP